MTALGAVSLASGYYHFVHFATRSAPFIPIAEKFDLSALTNRTVYFHIAEQGPVQQATGDSFPALVSQIRLAARVWNEVNSSELRIRFGGLAAPDLPQTSPGIDVIFDEVPPGLIAAGGPTARSEAITGPDGTFVPITRSVVMLPRNLSQSQSFSESFFLSLVHEFGHALGLQHAMTSSVMSTGLTRATTKSRPLAADDIAGISLLYPARGWAGTVGTIAGRVLANGEAVHGASVVAISPQGIAISTLTIPDGTYRVDGLPPGSYFIYAHPLPPPFAGEASPANIVLPLDADNRPMPVAGPFETRFYPGVRDPQQAVPVSVTAGAAVEGVNFSVQRRSPLQVYAVQTYSFPGQSAVNPAYLAIGGPRSFLVASGIGLVANGAPAPTLGVSVMGGAASVPPGGVRAYAPDTRFLQVDFQFNPFTVEGPRHLLFTTSSDLYIRPSGLVIAQRQPPSIAAITPGVDDAGTRIAAISGDRLSVESQVLFDGAPALVRGVEAGNLVVVPPPGPPGHRARVVVLNPDGQSSLFLQAASPALYDYPAEETPSFSIQPASLPAGAEAMVEVTAVDARLSGGNPTLGFGSSDVRIKDFWVLGPNRMLANVAVNPPASPVGTTVTLASGIQLLSQPFGFRIQPANPRQLYLQGLALDPARSGGPVQIRVANLVDPPPANLQATLNGVSVPVASAGRGLITLQIPAGFAAGPAVLRLQAGDEAALPWVLAIEPPLPVVLAISAATPALIHAGRPAVPGELLQITVSNLAEAGASVASSRVNVTIGGIDHSVTQVAPAGNPAGAHQVHLYLGPLPSGVHPLTVTIDGRTSAAYPLPVRP